MCMCYSQLRVTPALPLQEVVICISFAAPTLTLRITPIYNIYTYIMYTVEATYPCIPSPAFRGAEGDLGLEYVAYNVRVVSIVCNVCIYIYIYIYIHV